MARLLHDVQGHLGVDRADNEASADQRHGKPFVRHYDAAPPQLADGAQPDPDFNPRFGVGDLAELPEEPKSAR
ncbi:hypothetical protein [Bradyrhizobium sp. BR 1432]|uniref:hypothetical protein n=1 Tax=Bradyrhizobium sp. BR 1432 TaxID=3447966 RepID=UPI003EE4365F